jgi:hypothetical protein
VTFAAVAFGVLAFLVILGSAIGLSLIVRSVADLVHKSALALETAQKIDGIITEKATEILNRYVNIREKKAASTQTEERRVMTTEEAAAEQERRRQTLSFSDSTEDPEPFGGLGEQPMASVE